MDESDGQSEQGCSVHSIDTHPFQDSTECSSRNDLSTNEAESDIANLPFKECLQLSASADGKMVRESPISVKYEQGPFTDDYFGVDTKHSQGKSSSLEHREASQFNNALHSLICDSNTKGVKAAINLTDYMGEEAERKRLHSFTESQDTSSTSFVSDARREQRKRKKKGSRARVADLSPDQIHYCPHKGCTKKFAKKYNLKIHVRRHTGELPFACKVMGCGKRFMWHSSFMRHLRSHERRRRKRREKRLAQRSVKDSKALIESLLPPSRSQSKTSKNIRDMPKIEFPFEHVGGLASTWRTTKDDASTLLESWFEKSKPSENVHDTESEFSRWILPSASEASLNAFLSNSLMSETQDAANDVLENKNNSENNIFNLETVTPLSPMPPVVERLDWQKLTAEDLRSSDSREPELAHVKNLPSSSLHEDKTEAL